MSVFGRPLLTLAHLSDPHIRPATDPLVGGRVDPRALLERGVEVLRTWDHDCIVWLFSGDLTDNGDAEAYAWLRSAVEGPARERGVKVVWANGNHDERPAFRAGLLDAAPSDEPYNAEHLIGGLRILVLDTNLAGRPEGLVAPASLGWLRERLDRPAPDGTILVMHHTPLPPVQEAARLWPLQNPADVAPLVRGSDVRLILGGHFHQSSHGLFAGVPVSGATSLAYSQDLTDGRALRGQDAGQGFHLVQVYADQIMTTVVGLATGPQVHRRLSVADAQTRGETVGNRSPHA